MLPVSLIRDLSLSLQSLWGHKAIVVWCNGSTTGFGSVCPGSNPGTTAGRVIVFHPTFFVKRNIF